MLANNTNLARHNMVVQQIRPTEIIDERVLSLLEELPREDFVPGDYRGLAYADSEIPLDDDQHMMKPLLEAHLLQSLNIQPNDSVLEIGTGSGFLTACLAQLGGKVTSWEIRQGLSQTASERLESRGISNVELHTGDALSATHPENAYDVIAITGSLPTYDKSFEKCLKPGGRLYVVIGQAPVMEAMLITRIGDDIFKREALIETRLQPLDIAQSKEAFVF